MNGSKTILITGCSSGIGFQAANILKKEGWQVFATVRKEADKLLLEEQGLRVIVMDLNDTHSIVKGVEQVLAQTGGNLYALCNNAGFGQVGAIEDVSRNALRAQFETNVFGLQELTNLIVPVMRRQGYGRIIHISSMLGLVTMAYRGAYCASKYALESLADALRLELKGTGIFVSLIEPGPIQSEFRNNAKTIYAQNIPITESAHQGNYHSLMQNRAEAKKDSLFTLPPEAVVKKIQHALQSKRPRIRYKITFPAHFLAFLKRLLPDSWMEWVLYRIMKNEVKS